MINYEEMPAMFYLDANVLGGTAALGSASEPAHPQGLSSFEKRRHSIPINGRSSRSSSTSAA